MPSPQRVHKPLIALKQIHPLADDSTSVCTPKGKGVSVKVVKKQVHSVEGDISIMHELM